MPHDNPRTTTQPTRPGVVPTVAAGSGSWPPRDVHCPTSGLTLVAESEARIAGNLLDDAARYAEQALTATGEAVLSVADDGSGIPEADLERVFDRFVRLDTARSEAEGGGVPG